MQKCQYISEHYWVSSANNAGTKRHFSILVVTCCLEKFRTELWQYVKLKSSCLNMTRWSVMTSASKSRGSICRCFCLCLPPPLLFPPKSYHQTQNSTASATNNLNTVHYYNYNFYARDKSRIRQHSTNFDNNAEGMTEVVTTETDPLPLPVLSLPSLTSQHNTRTFNTSLLTSI